MKRSYFQLLSSMCVAMSMTMFSTAAEAPVNLGSASTFAILAGSTVTNVVSVGTVVIGDVGVFPGTAITGFPPGIVVGTIYAGGPIAGQAQGYGPTYAARGAGDQNSWAASRIVHSKTNLTDMFL